MPPKKKAEPTPDAPEGFAAVPGKGDQIVALADVYAEFVPRNARRTSTVLLFPAGQVISRKAYQHRLHMYEGYQSLEVKSR